MTNRCTWQTSSLQRSPLPFRPKLHFVPHKKQPTCGQQSHPMWRCVLNATVPKSDHYYYYYYYYYFYYCYYYSGILAPLCESVMLSTKPEVHNVLHYCIAIRTQKKTQPRPQVSRTENLLKLICMILASGQTKRQTDIHTLKLIAILPTLTGSEVIILCILFRSVNLGG